ncbi:MAG: type II toxin-antitoxin system VapC family toxin [Caldimonas sp.]
MIGLDTNILVRYLAQDDARQAAQSSRLMESFTPQAPGFVSIVTLVETIWVLQDAYARSRDDVAALLEALLQTEGLIVQMPDVVWQALRGFASSRADFADHLIERLGAAAGCTSTLTFDKAAAGDAGMRPMGPAAA